MSEYFATKYDSAAHEVIAILSDYNEGYGKEMTGDVDSPVGFIALVILDERCDLDFSDHTNYPVGDYAGEVARIYGVTAADVMGNHLVTTNTFGAVTVETFATAEEAQAEYDCRAAHYDAWEDVESHLCSAADDCPEDGTCEGPEGIYVCPVIGHGYHNV